MPNSSQARGRRQRTPYAWIGVGALSAGVCWAALAGAGIAAADNQVDSHPGRHASASAASAADSSPARRVAHASTARSVKPSAAQGVTFKAAALSSTAPAAATSTAAVATSDVSGTFVRPSALDRGRGYEYRAVPTICIVYTANEDNTVSVIDAASSRVTATITMPTSGTFEDRGNYVAGILANNDAVYVARGNVISLESAVTVVNGRTNAITTTIPLRNLVGRPAGLAGTDSGGKVYFGSSLVNFIDQATSQVTATPVASFGPVALSPNGRTLATVDGNAVVVANAVTYISERVRVDGFVRDLAFSPDGSRLFGIYGDRPNLLVFNPRTLTWTTPMILGSGYVGAALAVSPDGSRVYVIANNSSGNPSGSVLAVDASTNAVTATIPVGNDASDVALSLDGRFVYVANYNDSTVTVIRASTNTVINTIAVGHPPIAISVA